MDFNEIKTFKKIVEDSFNGLSNEQYSSNNQYFADVNIDYSVFAVAEDFLRDRNEIVKAECINYLIFNKKSPLFSRTLSDNYYWCKETKNLFGKAYLLLGDDFHNPVNTTYLVKTNSYLNSILDIIFIFERNKYLSL